MLLNQLNVESYLLLKFLNNVLSVEKLPLNANDTVFIQTQERDVYGTSHDQILPQSKSLFVKTFKYALH